MSKLRIYTIRLGPKQILNLGVLLLVVLFASPLIVEMVSRLTADHTVTPIQAIYKGNEDQPKVSLAVNVDWGEEHLPAILKVLDAQQVKATFFLTGKWTEKNPALAKEISRQGHEIGNHGYQHAHPNQLTIRQLEELIMKNEKLLEEITGQRTSLFAPPYGEYDENVLSVASRLDYLVIMWTLDTIDWQNPSPQTIYQRVVPRITNGAIILMHPRSNSLQALPTIVKDIKAKGFQFVPVGELLNPSHPKISL